MTDTTATDMFDVLVVGGGPVGACMGALLARGVGRGAAGRGSAGRPTATPFRVGILEPNRPQMPPADAPIDPRVVAVSRSSERILQAAGAWDRVSRLSAYGRMHIWHESVAPRSPGALVFDAADVGEPNLGYIVENRVLQAALLDSFADGGGGDARGGTADGVGGDARGGRGDGVGDARGRSGDDFGDARGGTGDARVIEPAELVSLRVGADSVSVETTRGKLAARLVVGADGALSSVRHAVGLTADSSDYRQTAIVATVMTERSHEKTAWQRFMRDGTLAFLPLADGTSSIVWSADNDVASVLLAGSPTEFTAELDRASDGALGATRLVSERASFPLRRLAAHRYVAQRVALIGDAAHVVHPLAGQGVNLGLLDAAALAQLILDARREREDPGALRVLRQYERWRKSEVAFMSTAIDGFDRLLAHGRGPLSKLAQRGLGLVNRNQELKRFFIARALGTSGELPRVAQRSVS